MHPLPQILKDDATLTGSNVSESGFIVVMVIKVIQGGEGIRPGSVRSAARRPTPPPECQCA